MTNLILEIGTNALHGLNQVDKLFTDLKKTKNYSEVLNKLERKLEEIFGCKFIIELARSGDWNDNCGVLPTYKSTGKIKKKEDLVKIGNIEKLNLILGENIISLLSPRELTAMFLHEVGHIVNHTSKFIDIITATGQISKLILLVLHISGFVILLPLLIVVSRTLTWTSHIGEYNADKFAVEYGYGDEFISLIHKFDKKHSESLSNISKIILSVWHFIFGSTHPDYKDRIEKVSKIMINDYTDKYKLDKKTKRILDYYEIEYEK